MEIQKDKLNQSKTVFLYWGPHPLHLQWGKLVSNKQVSIVPKFFTPPMKANTILTQISALFRSVIVPKADVYFIEGLVCLLPAAIRGGKKAKIIMINSDTFFFNYSRSKGLSKWIYKKYLKRIDGIISTSELMKKEAQKYTKVPNEVVYPYVAQKFFKFHAKLASKDIVYVGGLNHGKGIDILISAFEKIEKKHKNTLTLVGVVDEESAVKAALNNKSILLTRKRTKEPEKYFSAAGNYINAARIEPFGINVLEAMAVGIPPIVSKNCGAAEIVKNISPKLVIPPNPALIEFSFNWLNSNISRKKQLGKNARKLAENFDEKNCMKAFLSKFKLILVEVH